MLMLIFGYVQTNIYGKPCINDGPGDLTCPYHGEGFIASHPALIFLPLFFIVALVAIRVIKRMFS